MRHPSTAYVIQKCGRVRTQTTPTTAVTTSTTCHCLRLVMLAKS